jgi:protein O-GlcNAc transferase
MAHKPEPSDDEKAIHLHLIEAESWELIKDNTRAVVEYMHVLAINPQHVDAWLRLGHIFVLGLEWQKAIQAFEAVLQIQPSQITAQKLLALSYFNLGHREQGRALIEDAARRAQDASVWVLRAWILSSMDKSPAKTLALYQDWGRRFADPLTRQAKPFAPRDLSPWRKLKIGYVTADFKEHSIAFFMQPVLQNHDPQLVDVHVYSNGDPDYLTATIQQWVPHWNDVRALSDSALCQRIRADQIDVLVDLSGHTSGNRLIVFAERAAPVQVTWLGYMNTLGMKGMDYRLTDWGTDPEGSEAFYSEKLFRLECMASYVPPAYAPLAESMPMVRNGHPTLISLNNSFKITDAMLGVWARILNARSDARLIIMVKEVTPEAAQENMQQRVHDAGLPLDRVSVMPQIALSSFMELGYVADLALDTSPVSGGTTTIHALWMGLPVVALDAQRAIDASSARTLAGLGLAECVAADEDAYVRIVLDLLDNPERLEQLRASTRPALQASVLMDYRTRTGELEAAYRFMWINHLLKAPKYLHVRHDLAAAQTAVEQKALIRHG